MKINLQSDLVDDVLSLTNEYNYTPGEIISIGIAMAKVVLRERKLGNQILIVGPDGQKLGELREVEPRAIHEMAKQYIQSICPDMAEAPATLLVARLERERDMERPLSE
jgi:hypothetical protein